jgi:iron-sulfur cluster assembly protein
MDAATETTTPSAAPAPSPAKGVTLSPKAIEMAKSKMAKRGTPDAALRLGVRGGGCSGFSYVIEFSDEAPRERDTVYDFDGLKVYVDKKSIIYLAGTVLDWHQSLMETGFKFRNPREAAACGCGHSFTVK